MTDGQLALGEELRDVGIARVTSLPERKEWLDAGLDLIESLNRGAVLAADGLRTLLPEAPHNNLWGALFRTARSQGLIAPCGIQQSERPERHASLQRMWERL